VTIGSRSFGNLTRMRPARLALAVFTLVGMVLGGVAFATAAANSAPLTIEIHIHYSHYTPAAVTVPVGRPVTFVLINDDPIDHEWIVGDAALHERHRTGTEPRHDARPTEVTIDALSTRRTTITFTQTGGLQYICHLPGHEQYGMVGTLTITGS
jgi:uncharacterized cupredoxin-like copper-binding protein